jgi:hypothetical protein
MSTETKLYLEELHSRAEYRKDLLHRARRELEDGFIAEALGDLLHVVESLSASEERVMQLRAECFSMLEHSAKILDLDQRLRPIVISADVPASPTKGDPK